jgi:hypothetical protein
MAASRARNSRWRPWRRRDVTRHDANIVSVRAGAMRRYELVTCPRASRGGVSVLDSDGLGQAVTEARELLDCEWEIRDHDDDNRVVATSADPPA